MTKGTQYTQLIALDDHTCDGSEEDSVVNVTVHHDARLIGIKAYLMMNTTATDDYCLVEISDSGNFQAFTNDNSNTLLLVGSRFEIVTSGGANMYAESEVFGIDIPFLAGDRIFVNLIGTNTKIVDVHAILYWESV